MRKVRVVLADEHDFLRNCIKGTLEAQLSLCVVAEASLLDKTETILEHVEADMVLMHCPLPNHGTIVTTRNIRRRYPDVFVFLLTHYPHADLLKRSYGEAVHGFIGCGSSLQDLWKRLEQLTLPYHRRQRDRRQTMRRGHSNHGQGPAAVHGAVASSRQAAIQMLSLSKREQLFSRRGSRALLPDGRDALKIVAELTAREVEILSLIGDTFVNRQIAERLNISVRTVENHRASIKRKTGLPNTAGLVRLALAADLTRPSRIIPSN